MKIVIVDDDKDIGEILEIALQDDGYDSVAFSDSEEAMAYLYQNEYDMVILDIMMPSLTGYDLCDRIRKINDVPIIFITCLDDDESLTKALELGGDDYIRKPFSINEVMARIGAHLRRYKINSEKQSDSFMRKLGPYAYNAKERTVEYQNDNGKDNRIIRLSPLQNDILCFFVDHPNEILTYKMLYEAIWKEEYINDKGTIMVRVSSIRSKLPKLDIESIRGQGYRMIMSEL
ncbi:response regulator transcription factor [Anaerovorax odorimutans]|uniref:response regulator transcription factor n=1 Tax=Anaerovorax odorimutans TaxID=109327 RepID=UPI000400AE7F|nr:response regulator transcription factor [Anaerovorax odorimutans]